MGVGRAKRLGEGGGVQRCADSFLERLYSRVNHSQLKVFYFLLSLALDYNDNENWGERRGG